MTKCHSFLFYKIIPLQNETYLKPEDTLGYCALKTLFEIPLETYSIYPYFINKIKQNNTTAINELITYLKNPNHKDARIYFIALLIRLSDTIVLQGSSINISKNDSLESIGDIDLLITANTHDYPGISCFFSYKPCLNLAYFLGDITLDFNFKNQLVSYKLDATFCQNSPNKCLLGRDEGERFLFFDLQHTFSLTNITYSSPQHMLNTIQQMTTRLITLNQKIEKLKKKAAMAITCQKGDQHRLEAHRCQEKKTQLSKKILETQHCYATILQKAQRKKIAIAKAKSLKSTKQYYHLLKKFNFMNWKALTKKQIQQKFFSSQFIQKQVRRKQKVRHYQDLKKSIFSLQRHFILKKIQNNIATLCQISSTPPHQDYKQTIESLLKNLKTLCPKYQRMHCIQQIYISSLIYCLESKFTHTKLLKQHSYQKTFHNGITKLNNQKLSSQDYEELYTVFIYTMFAQLFQKEDYTKQIATNLSHHYQPDSILHILLNSISLSYQDTNQNKTLPCITLPKKPENNQNPNFIDLSSSTIHLSTGTVQDTNSSLSSTTYTPSSSVEKNNTQEDITPSITITPQQKSQTINEHLIAVYNKYHGLLFLSSLIMVLSNFYRWTGIFLILASESKPIYLITKACFQFHLNSLHKLELSQQKILQSLEKQKKREMEQPKLKKKREAKEAQKLTKPYL